MTRGIRNNNPLNIRYNPNNNWQGRVLVNNEREFEQFISMDYGFRAALLTIETYMLKYECNTIRKIISRWAPPTDGNNTEQYIRDVCMSTNIGGNEVISNHDKRLKDIVWAMARIESGGGIKDYQSSLDKAFDAFVPRKPADVARKKK